MSIEKENECPFCGENAETQLLDNNTYRFYTCPVCGRYELQEYPVQFGRKNKDKIAFYLYYTGNLNKPSNKHFSMLGSKSNYDKTVDIHPYCSFASMEAIDNFVPKSFNERIDRILLGFAKQSPYFGAVVERTTPEIVSSLFVNRFDSEGHALSTFEIDNQVQQIIEYLKNEGYIDYTTEKIILKPNGWSRIDRLQLSASSISKTVFVAMSFASEMKSIREAIKVAIEYSGYEPRIMDEIQHNHQIVPEMLHEIRESRFVVAELTGHNNGAYFEAGYALGNGKEVIQVCNKKAFGEDGHFDVKQVNTILWETTDELTQRLIDRIKATID